MKKITALTVFILALFVLLSLSWWQVQRLQWKNNIIEQLEADYAEDPQDTVIEYSSLRHSDDNYFIRYGNIKGVFDYEKEILVGPKIHEEKAGYWVITPLSIRRGGNVLVNRGWIADNKTDSLKENRPDGNITVQGIFRAPEWNTFTPGNSPANDIWAKMDIEEIAAAKEIAPIAPVMLYAESMSEPFDNLVMQQEKWMPRNKHLQYAIFWFVMALALAGVVGFAIRKKKENKT